MKTLLLTILAFLSCVCYSQTREKSNGTGQTDPLTQRISFIAGVGVGLITNDLYLKPSVNQTNQNVVMQDADNYRSSMSLGIVYIPYKTIVSYSGNKKDTVPHGIAVATFINPASFAKVSESQKFFNTIDFGFGLGYKFTGNFLIMGTIEFAGVRQPKDWFVNEFQNNNKPYIVDGSPQLSIDIDDDNIFKNKFVTTVGLKLCYSFDIIKQYNNKINGG